MFCAIWARLNFPVNIVLILGSGRPCCSLDFNLIRFLVLHPVIITVLLFSAIFRISIERYASAHLKQSFARSCHLPNCLVVAGNSDVLSVTGESLYTLDLLLLPIRGVFWWRKFTIMAMRMRDETF